MDSAGFSRRAFIGGAAASGVSLAGLSTLRKAAAAPQVTLKFTGWDFQPDLVRENLRIFESQNPDIRVDYSVTSGNYNDKMIPLFVAKTPLDACYVRDNNMVEWIKSGWIQPLEGLSELEQYKTDMFDYVRDAMTYEGKLYGLPYYTDYMAWFYNEEMLKKAGFDKCGKTWDEITKQAVEIKKRGIVEYPILLPAKKTGFYFYWAMVYASEGHFFDNQLNPVFQRKDSAALQLLQWMVDGIHKHKVIDIKSLENTDDDPPVVMAAGKAAFISTIRFFLALVNDPKRSQVAGKGRFALYPSLQAGQNGTVGWTRMYSLTGLVRDKDAAWRLIRYLGGKDKNGEYYTAKRWYKLWGLGYPYRSLGADPLIVEETRRWGDPVLMAEQQKTARAREAVKEPWYTQWDQTHQTLLQQALLQQISPQEALEKSAAAAVKAKSEWR